MYNKSFNRTVKVQGVSYEMSEEEIKKVLMEYLIVYTI